MKEVGVVQIFFVLLHDYYVVITLATVEESVKNYQKELKCVSVLRYLLVMYQYIYEKSQSQVVTLHHQVHCQWSLTIDWPKAQSC